MCPIDSNIYIYKFYLYNFLYNSKAFLSHIMRKLNKILHSVMLYNYKQDLQNFFNFVYAITPRSILNLSCQLGSR